VALLRHDPRCASTGSLDPLHSSFQSQREQVTRATLSHGVSARGTGRYALALAEFGFVLENLDALNNETLPVVFRTVGCGQDATGRVRRSESTSEPRGRTCDQAPLKRPWVTRWRLEPPLLQSRVICRAGFAGFQEAFAALQSRRPAGRLRTHNEQPSSMLFSTFPIQSGTPGSRCCSTGSLLS